MTDVASIDPGETAVQGNPGRTERRDGYAIADTQMSLKAYGDLSG